MALTVLDTFGITWTCHVCGKERLDSKISVKTVDLSDQWGLPAKTIQQNIRFCNDSLSCMCGVEQKIMTLPTLQPHHSKS